jgi:hypothetical protein
VSAAWPPRFSSPRSTRSVLLKIKPQHFRRRRVTSSGTDCLALVAVLTHHKDAQLGSRYAILGSRASLAAVGT